MTNNIVLKKMKTVHFNLPNLSENSYIWRNHLSLHMGLNHTVHTLMNVYPSWKIVFSINKRRRGRYFHHLAIISYFHQEIFHWKVSLFFIHWNRRICEIIIIDVSCQVVWCSMTYHEYNQEQEIRIPRQRRWLFLQRLITKIFICPGGPFKTFTRMNAYTSV